MANRPQIDPKREQAASVQFVVRMTPSQAAKVKRAAERRGVPVSHVIREAVEQVGR